MINGSRGQGPLGSTEALSVHGTDIAAMGTWDAKVCPGPAHGINVQLVFMRVNVCLQITSLMAMLGGVAPINARYLSALPNLYERFVAVVDREHRLAFPALAGQDVPIAAPSGCIPRLSDFAPPRRTGIESSN